MLYISEEELSVKVWASEFAISGISVDFGYIGVPRLALCSFNGASGFSLDDFYTSLYLWRLGRFLALLSAFRWVFLALHSSLNQLKNGDRYDVGVSRSRIGSCPWAIDWHHDL